jgi:DNA-binding MarR family transcriptional regulator
MDEKRQQLIHQLIEAIRLISRPGFLMGTSKFNLEDFIVLDHLEETSQASMGDVANKFSMAASTMTGIVDRLVRQKLIRREHSKTDRRKVVMELTAKGKRTLQKIWENLMQTLEVPLSLLTQDEIETLVRIIKKLASPLTS